MTSSLLVAMVLLGTPQHSNVYPGQLRGHPDRPGGPARVLPLLDTQVTADIAGIAARVTVVQTFKNPYKTPIEAVYTFPLRSGAAVDRMRMKIGDRIIESRIKRKEEARAEYEAAKAAGQSAALLDQERPNIFTQSVANIMPGSTVEIEISYVDVLEYKDGEFQFVFPMVVGPRNPMNADDPDKIVPTILPVGVRTGNDIKLSVTLNAGGPLDHLNSQLHAIDVKKTGEGRYLVSLSRNDEIPNRDFILTWRPEGEGLTESFIAHAQSGKGTFCLTIVPPARATDDYVTSREVIFVMDQSGSQRGFPLEKSKELTLAMIDKLRPGDTFNVVTFTTGVNFLWPEALPNNMERVREAKQFVKGLSAGGGTNFIPPLTATLKDPPRDGRLKLIIFNSDGYVGDEFDILNLVRDNRHNARLFTFGIGNSVNRFLIDNMSAEGRGASEIITLATDVDVAIKRFVERTRNPILTDVVVTIVGGGVHDVTPKQPPDMFDSGPLVVFGRYDRPGPAKVTISGQVGGRPWHRTIDVVFPAEGEGGSGITKAWARKRLDDMMREDWLTVAASVRNGSARESNPEPMILFALEHGLMSQWTSFVAVEKLVVNEGGVSRTIEVPVDMASGVTMGGELERLSAFLLGQGRAGNPGRGYRRSGGPGGGFGGGGGGGFGGGGGAQAAVGRGGQGSVPKGIRLVLNDPTTNSYIVVGGNIPEGITKIIYDPKSNTLLVQGTDAAIQELEALIAKSDLDSKPKVVLDTSKRKIHKDLLKKAGTLKVIVRVEDWSQDLVELLTKAGLTVTSADQDEKTVTGTIDANDLLKLAGLEYVTEIRPLTVDPKLPTAN